MVDKENDNQVLSYDVDFLEAFIQRLTAVIDGFEEPAKHVKEVGEVFHAEASRGTNTGADAKCFQPLGKAVDVAVGKIGSNLSALVEHLRHDRSSLQNLLEKVRHTESESAHSIQQTGTPETVV